MPVEPIVLDVAVPVFGVWTGVPSIGDAASRPETSQTWSSLFAAPTVVKLSAVSPPVASFVAMWMVRADAEA